MGTQIGIKKLIVATMTVITGASPYGSDDPYSGDIPIYDDTPSYDEEAPVYYDTSEY